MLSSPQRAWGRRGWLAGLVVVALAAPLAPTPALGGPGVAPSPSTPDPGLTSISLRSPDGELVAFTLTPTSVMKPALAAAHPEITTYAGREVGGTATLALDLTPAGMHGSVRSADGTWYVDPAAGPGGRYRSSFETADPPASLPADDTGGDRVPTAAAAPVAAPGALATLRTYRLALLTDATYAAAVAPGLTGAASDAAVLAAKVTLVNRVDQVYEDDLGIHLTLAAGTDRLNFDTAAEAYGTGGPCGGAACFPAGALTRCTSTVLSRARLVIGQVVGAASYDVGHVGLGVDGGGSANVGVVGAADKAAGCTGIPAPVGDAYAIDYLAHELGHQFGALHTFNGVAGNCAGANRTAAGAVEPGSGSSIMGYAGICGQDDLQRHSDPYFSQRSQSQIATFTAATPPAPSQVSSVAFTGFGAGDTFTLTVGSLGTTPTYTRGTFTGRGIATDITALYAKAGQTVTVTVTPYAFTSTATIDDNGFTVTIAGAPANQHLTANPVGASASSNELVAGGPATNGGRVTTSTNHNPVVTAPVTRSIPTRTPFELTGTATDPDGDPLTFLWEQNDAGGSAGTALTDNTKVDGPLFRQFSTYAEVPAPATYGAAGEHAATASPTRTFPDLAQVLADDTNAASGACPAAPGADGSGVSTVPRATLDCYSEFLPTAAYAGSAAAGNDQPSLDFRLTARDGGGVAGQAAGGVASADVRLTLDRSAGPFRVTSQGAASRWVSGAGQVVTWAVNGTDKPTLAPTVRISFSADGGQTWPYVLAAATPNDGSETVTAPPVQTTAGRIRVEAVGNVFFDVNHATIAVSDGVAPQTTLAGGASGFLLGRDTTFALSSSVPGSTFACTLDGAALPCAAPAVRLGALSATTHTFTAVATDPGADTDATPATATFTVVRDDRVFDRVTGRWKRTVLASAYQGTVTRARGAGAVLAAYVTRARALALVVVTKPSYGAVQVRLAGTRLRTVKLKGPAGRQKVVSLGTFDKPVTGKLTLTTLSGRRVVVDGLGVATG